MNRKSELRLLLIVWGALFALCAGLGFVPEPTGAARVLLTVLGVAFFLPGGLLLMRFHQDGQVLRLVRNLSAASLLLTLALLIANVAAALASETVGNVLYGILVVVSSPMVCMGSWAVSLFLWACLLIAGWMLLHRQKKAASSR